MPDSISESTVLSLPTYTLQLSGHRLTSGIKMKNNHVSSLANEYSLCQITEMPDEHAELSASN